MFVALVRAYVLSGMGLSLRASSYANPIPLITITALYKHRKAKTPAFQASKTNITLIFTIFF